MLRWRQAVDGIPAADSELRVNVARDGRVLSSSAIARRRTSRRHDARRSPRARRCARCRTRVGAYRALPRDEGPAGATRATTYADGTTAALTLASDRLAWRVTYRASSTAVWDMFVDAGTGHVRKRVNMVKSDVPAKVWENYPGAASGGTADDRRPRARLAPASAHQLFGRRTCTRSPISTTTTPPARARRSRPGSYTFSSVTRLRAARRRSQCSWIRRR